MKVRCINDREFASGSLGFSVIYTVERVYEDHYELVENKRICWAKTRFKVMEEFRALNAESTMSNCFLCGCSIDRKIEADSGITCLPCAELVYQEKGEPFSAEYWKGTAVKSWTFSLDGGSAALRRRPLQDQDQTRILSSMWKNTLI